MQSWCHLDYHWKDIDNYDKRVIFRCVKIYVVELKRYPIPSRFTKWKNSRPGKKISKERMHILPVFIFYINFLSGFIIVKPYRWFRGLIDRLECEIWWIRESSERLQILPVFIFYIKFFFLPSFLLNYQWFRGLIVRLSWSVSRVKLKTIQLVFTASPL